MASPLTHINRTIMAPSLDTEVDIPLSLNDGKPCPCGKANWSDMERIRRTTLMKTLLFWLPLRRYHCYRCLRNRWAMDK